MLHGEQWDEYPDLDPILFRLANGNHVEVVFGYYWTRVEQYDFYYQRYPTQFYGVRIYSNEGTLSERRIYQYELRAPHDFIIEVAIPAHHWLDELVQSRGLMDFDTLDELFIEFAEELARLSETPEDATKHYAEGLIEDPLDDDLSTDQNEE